MSDDGDFGERRLLPVAGSPRCVRDDFRRSGDFESDFERLSFERRSLWVRRAGEADGREDSLARRGWRADVPPGDCDLERERWVSTSFLSRRSRALDSAASLARREAL